LSFWQVLGLRVLRVKRRPPLHFVDGICDEAVPLTTPRFGREHIALDPFKVSNSRINQTVGVSLPHLFQQLRRRQVGDGAD
jgi:hypothetical protein